MDSKQSPLISVAIAVALLYSRWAHLTKLQVVVGVFFTSLYGVVFLAKLWQLTG